jgi:hypothetical protein
VVKNALQFAKDAKAGGEKTGVLFDLRAKIANEAKNAMFFCAERRMSTFFHMKQWSGERG